MTTLAAWYPGDRFVLGVVQTLALITLLIALAVLAERLLARRRAIWRSTLWQLTLAAVVLAPGSVLLSQATSWRLWSWPAVEPGTPTVSAQAQPVRAFDPVPMGRLPLASNDAARVTPKTSLQMPVPVASVIPVTATLPQPTTQTSVPAEMPATAPPIPWTPGLIVLAGMIWAAGSMYLGLRLVVGSRRLQRLLRDSRPLDRTHLVDQETRIKQLLEWQSLPEVAVSAWIGSPVVAGLRRPRVLLPADLVEQVSEQQLTEILLHECAHVARGDLWFNLLQRITTVLFWVHPLIYVLRWRLDQAQEEVCDNYVLACTSSPDYAETLLTVATVCYPGPLSGAYLTMMPRHANLETRVADLLAEERDTSTRLSRRVQVLLAVCLLGLVVVGSFVGQRDAPAAQEPKKETPADNPPQAKVDGKVTGKVILQADNSPLAGVTVELLKNETIIGEPRTRKVVTNAQGEFVFTGIPAGSYQAFAFQGNLMSRDRFFSGEKVIVDKDGASQPITLKMKPGLEVKVKVLSQATGQPIKDARVRLIWTDTKRDHRTGADGTVTLQALTAETWHIQAAAPDHAAQTQVLNLGNKEPASVEYRLPPGGTLQGTIRDETGKELAGIGLDVHAQPDSAHLDYLVSAKDGRYRIDYLPLGQGLTLSASKDGYQTVQKSFRLGAGEPVNGQLDVVIKKRPPGGAIAGIVTDEAGKPIADAQISNHGNSSAHVLKTKTDAQGRFLLDNVYNQSSRYELIVRATRFAPQRVSFTPGTTEKPAEIAIKLARGHSIRGRAVDEKGKPIAGAYVYFAHGNSPWGIGGSGRTDKDGRFQFDSLPADCPFTIRATGYSELPETSLPLDGDKEVVVTLKAQGALKGRVFDVNTSQPITRFNVKITFSPDRRPDEPSSGIWSQRVNPGEQFVSAQGSFVLKDLLAGMPLQVTIEAPGYERKVIRRVEVRPIGEAETLAIGLTAEDPANLQTVKGKLLNGRGEPVRGAEMRLIVAAIRPPAREDYPFNWQMIESGQIEQAADVLQYQKQVTGPDGSFAFPRVPKNAEIELVYWGQGIADARVDHLEQRSEKDRANLVITAAAPVRITGTLDLKAFPDASDIQLSGRGRYYRGVRSDDKKTFTFSDVAAGSYELQVYGRQEPVEVPGGFRVTVVARKPLVLQEGQDIQVTVNVADKANR